MGEGGRGGLAGAARPRVRLRRGEARRPLPQRERRREVHARQRRAQDPRAGLVLLVGLPGPEERGPPLPAERPDAQVDRRRQDLREHARAARRQPRHVDRPRRRIALHRRQRRRRDDHVQRRQELVDPEQPADGAVLPRHDGQPVSLLGLRLAAGQLERRDPERRRGRCDRPLRLASGRRRGERLDGGRSGRPQHRLRRRVRRDHHALRPPHQAGADRHGVAAAGRRARDEGPEVPVPVERAHHGLAERPQGGLPRVADPAAHPRRRRDVGGDLAGPDAQRQGQAGQVRRAHRDRRHGRRAVLHDLRARRVGGGSGRDLGGLRRRPRPRHARQRQDLAERDAEGDSRVDPDQRDRRLAAGQGHGVRRGDDVQVGRLPALPLQDERLREDLDEDRQRDPGRRLHARRARGPGAPGTALRRDRARPLRLVRRRGQLAAVPAQPSLHAGHGPRREERRPRRRHAGARVLDPRRPDPAAEVGRDDRGLPGVPVPAAPDRARRHRGARAKRTRPNRRAGTSPRASSWTTG